MHSLRNVSCVKIVMIRISMPAVSLLDSSQKALQYYGGNFEFVDHSVPIQQIITEIFHRCSHCGFIQ